MYFFLLMCMLYFFLCVFFLIIRRPPRSTRSDTLFPYTTLFRSLCDRVESQGPIEGEYSEPSRFASNSPKRSSPLLLHRSSSWPNTRSPLSRSEEHTSELQSLMRISYAVFCLKKKKISAQQTT